MDSMTKVDLPPGVDERDLRRAVGVSRSWRGVLRELGLSSAHRGRQLRATCALLGIDTRHFGTRSWSDAELRTAVAAAGTWLDLTRSLGYAEDSGSARATVRKHALRLGLDVGRLSSGPMPPPGALAAVPDLAHLRSAGPYLVAAACVLAGHRVSWPLEPAVYDLLVDDASGIHRVQVKTCTSRLPGSWECSISRSEYARVPGGKRRVHYMPEEIDVFGIVDGDLEVYLVPLSVVAGAGTLSMRRYAAFRLPRMRSAPDAASGGLDTWSG